MALEQFDETLAKAKTFISALQNYYYLNSDLFSSESCCVASTLSHFKVGTSAREWACNQQTTALETQPIDYRMWRTFKTDLKAHFIPVQTEQQAMNAIWTIKMGTHPFHDWY